MPPTWFAREGLLAEAVSHYVAIGAWVDAAAELVDDLAVGELLLGGPTRVRWPAGLADLPEELVNPAACIVRAVLALVGGDRERFGEQVDLAQMLAPPEPGPHHRAVSLTVEVLQVVHARLLGDPGATLSLAEQAEQTLSARDNRFRVEQHPELVALSSRAGQTPWPGRDGWTRPTTCSPRERARPRTWGTRTCSRSTSRAWRCSPAGATGCTARRPLRSGRQTWRTASVSRRPSVRPEQRWRGPGSRAT